MLDIISDVLNIYCDGDYCLHGSVINGVNNVIVNGTNTMSTSNVTSFLSFTDDKSFKMKIYGNNNESFNTICSSTDICYIGCYHNDACAGMILHCLGECFVDCDLTVNSTVNHDYIQCPIVANGNYSYWDSTSTTIDPSYIPSELPSELPSKIPSNIPSNEPSDDPTKMPSDHPTYVPT